MAVLVQVINESRSGISSSSEVLASGNGAHVSSGVHREPLILGEAQVVFCCPRLFGQTFAVPLFFVCYWSRLFGQAFPFFAGYGFSRGLNVRPKCFFLSLAMAGGSVLPRVPAVLLFL